MEGTNTPTYRRESLWELAERETFRLSLATGLFVEAAAATALMFLGGAAEEDPSVPMPFVVDRPFYFFIQERMTGAVLFMGRVLNPAA